MGFFLQAVFEKGAFRTHCQYAITTNMQVNVFFNQAKPH